MPDRFTPRVVLSCLAGSALAFTACQRVEEQGGLAEAEALLRVLDYGEAQKRLEQFQPELAAESPQGARTRYALMLATWHASPASEASLFAAETLARELIATPQLEATLRARVQLDLARMLEVMDYAADVVDVAQARALYREVAAQAPQPALRYEAVIRLANTHRKELAREANVTAAQILREFLETAPPEALWSAVAWQVLGDIYGDHLADYRRALEAYQAAWELGFANQNDVDLYVYKMARWAEETAQPARALELFTVIAGEMPLSTYQSLARQRIVELGGTPPAANWLTGGGMQP